MFAFLRRLFSRGRKAEWHRSEDGNLTCVRKGVRLTVYKDGRRGWKYCIAPNLPDSEPYFCEEKYKTRKAAKRAAEKEAHTF